MYVTTQAWSLESGWGGVQGTAWAVSVQPHHVSSLHKRASRVAPLADGHGTQPAHPTLLFRVLRRQQPAHHAWLQAAADAAARRAPRSSGTETRATERVASWLQFWFASTAHGQT